MNRIIKTTLIAALAAVVSFGASACGGSASASDVDASKQIRVGTSPGPYSELFKKGVAHVLEKKGYKLTYTSFSDLQTATRSIRTKAVIWLE